MTIFARELYFEQFTIVICTIFMGRNLRHHDFVKIICEKYSWIFVKNIGVKFSEKFSMYFLPCSLYHLPCKFCMGGGVVGLQNEL